MIGRPTRWLSHSLYAQLRRLPAAGQLVVEDHLRNKHSREHVGDQANGQGHGKAPDRPPPGGRTSVKYTTPTKHRRPALGRRASALRLSAMEPSAASSTKKKS